MKITNTELSKYIWNIKREDYIEPILKWKIRKNCHQYKAGNNYYVWRKN